MNTPMQQHTTPSSSQTNRQNRTVSNTTDPGNPVKVLETKGITEDNKFDLIKLAEVLLSYGDFKKAPNSMPYIKRDKIHQIKAIASLLREIARQQTMSDVDTTITQTTLDKALSNFKDNLLASLSTMLGSNGNQATLSNYMNTYANAVRFNAAPRKSIQKKQVTSQKHDILVSMKNVDRSHNLLLAHPTELARLVETKIKEAYKEPLDNANTIMIKSVNRLPNGNLILQATSDALAERLHIQNNWVTTLAPGATVPQRTYAIVVHNVPSSI